MQSLVALDVFFSKGCHEIKRFHLLEKFIGKQLQQIKGFCAKQNTNKPMDYMSNMFDKHKKSYCPSNIEASVRRHVNFSEYPCYRREIQKIIYNLM